MYTKVQLCYSFGIYSVCYFMRYYNQWNVIVKDFKWILHFSAARKQNCIYKLIGRHHKYLTWSQMILQPMFLVPYAAETLKFT